MNRSILALFLLVPATFSAPMQKGLILIDQTESQLVEKLNTPATINNVQNLKMLMALPSDLKVELLKQATLSPQSVVPLTLLATTIELAQADAISPWVENMTTYMVHNLDALLAVHPHLGHLLMTPKTLRLGVAFEHKLLADRKAHGLSFSHDTPLLVLPGQSIASALFINAHQIAVGSSQGTIHLINLLNGTTRTIANAGKIYAMALARPDILAVASDQNNDPNFYDITTGTYLGHHSLGQGGHTQQITALAALDNNRLASASSDGSIFVWNAATNPLQVQRYYPHPENPPSYNALAIANPQRVWAGSSQSAEIDIVDTSTNHMFALPMSTGIESIASLDSTRKAVGLTNGNIVLIDMSPLLHNQSAQPNRMLLEGHSGHVTALQALNNERIVSASSDGTSKIWNAQTGQEILTLDMHSDPIVSLATCMEGPVGKILLGTKSGTVTLWHLHLTEFLRLIQKERVAQHLHHLNQMLSEQQISLLSVEQALQIMKAV